MSPGEVYQHLINSLGYLNQENIRVNKSEFTRGLQNLKFELKVPEMDALFQAIDKKSENYVDVDSFCNLFSDSQKKQTVNNLRDYVLKYNLDLKDLETAFGKLSDDNMWGMDKLKQIIKLVDGKILDE